MMKRFIQISLLALWGAAIPAASMGVNVPQASAAAYIFTSPRLTNHIHGVLIDTTNAYGVIRSEDIDWLNEAFTERECILDGWMRTNNLPLGVGPKVSLDDVPHRIPGTGWLDGDAPLLTSCRFYFNYQSYTNIYERTDYTNGFTNAYSVITMPMIDGTTSVFTNCWTYSYKVFSKTTAVTNISVISDVDECHGVEGVPFPAYSNTTRLAWWRVNETRIPNVRYFSDAREALRGTVRLADIDSRWTNSTYTIEEEEVDIGGQSYHRIVGTNFIGDVIYDYSAGKWSSAREHTPPFTGHVYTRFHSSIVSNRVSVEAAFAHCWFSYNPYPGDSFTRRAAVRLANPSLDMSGELAYCRVLIDPYSLCATCAAAAGCPTPPSSLSYRESEGRSSSWHLSIDTITIFYRITPSTRLPDW